MLRLGPKKKECHCNALDRVGALDLGFENNPFDPSLERASQKGLSQEILLLMTLTFLSPPVEGDSFRER